MIRNDPSRKTPRLKAGDVLAIPRKRGGDYFVVYITSNRFGDAFGILKEFGELSDLPLDWSPHPFGTPVYSGKASVANGRWRRLGRREDLLKLFSQSPPIYHRKADNLSNQLIGSHGSAESPSGSLRDLTELEADQIGLTKGTYRQIMLEEELERYLELNLG